MGFQRPLMGIKTVIICSSGSRSMSSHFYIELIKIDLEHKCKYKKRWEESLGGEISFKQWSVIWHRATTFSASIIKRKS